jgi:hypothetical protein
MSASTWLAADERVGHQLVQVELDGVGPGAFELLGVVRPAAGPAAISGRDHGDRERLFQVLDLTEVEIGRQLIFLERGEERRGLGKTFRGGFHVVRRGRAARRRFAPRKSERTTSAEAPASWSWPAAWMMSLNGESPHDEGIAERQLPIMELVSFIGAVRLGVAEGRHGAVGFAASC